MVRRALITGATGGLGRVLVPLLLENGYAVRATGRDSTIGAELASQGAQFYAADLAETDPAPMTSGIDVVFHLAALSSPWGRREIFHAVNVEATRRLLAAAKSAGCSAFIYASTPSIYAERRNRLGITERADLPARFANDYAATKFAAERAVLSADEPGFRTLALRPRAIVGQFDTVLLPRLLRAARLGRIMIPGDGKALIELTDARDVAAAFLAADRTGAHGQAVNISGGQPRPLHALLERIFAELGLSVALRRLPVPIALAAASLAETVAALLPGRPEPPVTRYSVMTFAFSQTFD
ncbi:MAG TPA: NAD-dependent epimerase/dehydratase family protein, partial [Magnetospirillaceae bacterium]|nr:NAD-dependent epimerase/dehydratase family protein [Magnetospirillaceae bacterium]